jgi:Flp pilus assembly protein TadD
MTPERPADQRRDGLDLLPAFLAALAAGVVYFLTLAPTVTSADSGELVTAACTLGVAHPPGYPLWCLLGKAFSLLPVSSPAWRVNLMSAAFGALTAALVYLICKQLAIPRVPAFAGALAFAFSRTFWSQSVIAEVYTLNTFFLCGIILLLLLWGDRRRNTYLYAAAGVFGLSLSHHYMLMLLISPAFAIYVLWVSPRLLRDLRLVFGCLALVLAGLLVYIYLPLAAARGALINWGEPDTWARFWHHVARAQYRATDFEAPFSLSTKLLYIGHVVRLLYNGFTPLVLVPFGLMGCWALRSRRKECALLGAVFLLNTVVLIMILQLAYIPDNLTRVEVYYLPAYACTAVFIAAGPSWAWSALGGAAGRAVGTAGGIMLCLGAVLSPLVANWNPNDMSRNYLAYDFSRTALESLEPNAVYFCAPDFSGFPAIYLHAVERLRPDVLLADVPTYPTPGLRRYLAGLNPPVPANDVGTVQEELILRGERPVYIAPMSGPLRRRGYKFDPWGFVFKARRSGQPAAKGGPGVFGAQVLRNLDIPTPLKDFDCVVLLCYYLMRAEKLMSEGRIKEAAADYRIAAQYAVPYPAFINNIGLICARRCMNREAEEFYRKTIEAAPSYVGAYWNLAILLERQGRIGEALTICKKAQSVSPGDESLRGRIDTLTSARPLPRGGDVDQEIRAARSALLRDPRDPERLVALGYLCTLRGDLEEALAAYRTAVEVEPNYRRACEALALFYENVVQDPEAAASYAKKARGP